MQPPTVTSAVSHWLDISNLITALLVAAITAVASWLIQRATRRPDRRLGYCVMYDEVINQGGPLNTNGSGQPSPSMWEITYRGPDPANPGQIKERTVANGSIAIVELQNRGKLPLREQDFAANPDNKRLIRVRFPGRTVVGYKVRNNEEFHQFVSRRATPPSGTEDSFTLPATDLNPGEKVQLMVLLEAQAAGSVKRTRVSAKILGGTVRRYARPLLGLSRKLLSVLAALVLVGGLAAGVVLGIGIGSHASNGPQATCAPTGATLKVSGSTAFGPLANLVATEFEQQCPQNIITIDLNASGDGTADLRAGTADIAMVDGMPGDPGGLTPLVIGEVVYAVVGNADLANVGPQALFDPGGGLPHAVVAQAFRDGRRTGAAVQVSGFAQPIITVGRDSNSGTYHAFIRYIHGESVDGFSADGVFDLQQQTTLSLLSYINANNYTIGYGDPDALRFYPSVREISVDGVAPTRGNVLTGKYTFTATERLYTNGNPTGLAEDYISFLQMVVRQLQDDGFISCPELKSAGLNSAC